MELAQETDENLMVRFGRGEAAAFEFLYRRHESRVFRFLRRNVRNEAAANDLMQEVWFAVVRGAATYQPTAKFTTWLFTIAHNRTVDMIRATHGLQTPDAPRDEQLPPRYGQAGADAPGPSDAVRAAILAESRRVAGELAKPAPRQPVDVSRPAANDSRWKITAFGTAGAALLAALLFAPRYWEGAPPVQVSMAPPPAPADAAPSFTEPARQSPSESDLQETIVTGAKRRTAKSNAAPSPNPGAPAPTLPPGVGKS